MGSLSGGAPRSCSILLAFLHFASDGLAMPVCTQNVKKRKARQVKNDRLQAAKDAKLAQAAKAKG